jgi:hypothetical protein
MMGFIVSIAIFLLALVVAESAIVGKTTSESVLEFPKTDIQDLRSELMGLRWDDFKDKYQYDIVNLSLERKNAVVWYEYKSVDKLTLYIHYNNGITQYNEVYSEED